MKFLRAGTPRAEAGFPSNELRTCANGVFPLINLEDRILVTGATGFIGARVVQCLVDRGFRNLVCFARPSSDLARLNVILQRRPRGARVDLIRGTLLSRQDCRAATESVALVLHLAAGTGEKSFADAFVNSVVATRNLIEASVAHECLRRFVLVSSFSVYANRNNPQGRRLDESCPVETRPEQRGEAYCFAKVEQEQLVVNYGQNRGLPYVVVRPGSVYGPGKPTIPGRVGIDTFGVFVHLGGSNRIPFTYVDNCAEAIVLAGLTEGIDGEVFNVVDDDLPSSRRFLRLYKRNVRSFRSLYLPHALSFVLCYLWEKYSQLSEGQLPPAFNRRRWHTDWKRTHYSNEKLKCRLGWTPRVPTNEALKLYFQSCAEDSNNA